LKFDQNIVSAFQLRYVDIAFAWDDSDTVYNATHAT